MSTKSTVLVLAAGLSLGLNACNKTTQQQATATTLPASTSAANSTPAAPATPASEGPALYAKANCAMCHGDDRAGKPLGPSLLALQQHWTADDLVAYLQDPQGYAEKNPRLLEQKKQYSMKMPAPALTPEELQVLARWLLE